MCPVNLHAKVDSEGQGQSLGASLFFLVGGGGGGGGGGGVVESLNLPPHILRFGAELIKVEFTTAITDITAVVFLSYCHLCCCCYYCDHSYHS